MPDGQPSGIFMELALTADKPFERKVNGLLAHNAIYFGQPLCDCDESKIYNLTFCKKTHYNQITFEMMCHRAHVPTWQALREMHGLVSLQLPSPCCEYPERQKHL